VGYIMTEGANAYLVYIGTIYQLCIGPMHLSRSAFFVQDGNGIG